MDERALQNVLEQQLKNIAAQQDLQKAILEGVGAIRQYARLQGYEMKSDAFLQTNNATLQFNTTLNLLLLSQFIISPTASYNAISFTPKIKSRRQEFFIRTIDIANDGSGVFGVLLFKKSSDARFDVNQRLIIPVIPSPFFDVSGNVTQGLGLGKLETKLDADDFLLGAFSTSVTPQTELMGNFYA